jgi:tetratricopeptide (TPR) repeat protein
MLKLLKIFFLLTFCNSVHGQSSYDPPSASYGTQQLKYSLIADSCLYTNKDTISARKYYEKALAIKDECWLKAKLKLLDGEIICCGEGFDKYSKEYLCAIRRGEIFFKWGKYALAVPEFQNAANLHKDAQYPLNMIKTCNEQIKQQAEKREK